MNMLKSHFLRVTVTFLLILNLGLGAVNANVQSVKNPFDPTYTQIPAVLEINY